MKGSSHEKKEFTTSLACSSFEKDNLKAFRFERPSPSHLHLILLPPPPPLVIFARASLSLLYLETMLIGKWSLCDCVWKEARAIASVHLFNRSFTTACQKESAAESFGSRCWCRHFYHQILKLRGTEEQDCNSTSTCLVCTEVLFLSCW